MYPKCSQGGGSRAESGGGTSGGATHACKGQDGPRHKHGFSYRTFWRQNVAKLQSPTPPPLDQQL